MRRRTPAVGPASAQRSARTVTSRAPAPGKGSPAHDRTRKMTGRRGSRAARPPEGASRRGRRSRRQRIPHALQQVERWRVRGRRAAGGVHPDAVRLRGDGLMATGPRYKVPMRRRREVRTDYHQRLRLLKSGKPRLVARVSNAHVRAQLVTPGSDGDETHAAASSEELGEYGWDAPRAISPARTSPGTSQALAPSTPASTRPSSTSGSTRRRPATRRSQYRKERSTPASKSRTTMTCWPTGRVRVASTSPRTPSSSTSRCTAAISTRPTYPSTSTTCSRQSRRTMSRHNDGWEPRTRLGRKVQNGDISSMEQALDSGLPLKGGNRRPAPPGLETKCWTSTWSSG